MDHIFALGQLDRLSAFYTRVEAKASFMFAINMAMLSLVAVNFPVRDPLSLLGCLSLVPAVLLTISVFEVYRTFFPHLRAPDRGSLIYFGKISAMDEGEYIRQLQAATAAEIAEDAASQIWRNAEILTYKFERVNNVYFLTMASSPFWLAFLAVNALCAGKFSLKIG